MNNNAPQGGIGRLVPVAVPFFARHPRDAWVWRMSGGTIGISERIPFGRRTDNALIIEITSRDGFPCGLQKFVFVQTTGNSHSPHGGFPLCGTRDQRRDFRHHPVGDLSSRFRQKHPSLAGRDVIRLRPHSHLEFVQAAFRGILELHLPPVSRIERTGAGRPLSFVPTDVQLAVRHVSRQNIRLQIDIERRRLIVGILDIFEEDLEHLRRRIRIRSRQPPVRRRLVRLAEVGLSPGKDFRIFTEGTSRPELATVRLDSLHLRHDDPALLANR